MKRKLFALFFALAASIGLSWGTEVTSPTAITWDESVISSIELYEVNDSFTNSGITIQMTERQFGGGFYLSKFSTGGQATFVFSSTVGDITGITINAGSVQLNFTGWGGDQTTATWSGTPSSSVTASATPFIDIDQISSIVFTIGPAPEPVPQRYTAPVKAEDLIVGDTLAQGALLSTQRYEGFWFATGRARYHGQVVTMDYLCSFERLGAVSKHGAIDSEAMGYRGCFEPINENGQLGEEWVVTSVSPFTIAGIGTAVITNTNYTSAVDYAVIEPGDTLSEGALIQNGPTIYWMLQDRVYYNDIPRDESDTYLERYHTFGQNGVFEDGGGIIKPRNEQGEEGSKWLVVYYSPLTLAGIGAPSMTLTLAENVSIVGLPIDGITDKGNGVYEVVKGTVFSVQVAEPEHYTFDHWADLGSDDPQYAANPRTITMTGNMNLTPVYNIDTYSLTIGVNDPARGSVKIAPTTQKVVWSKEHLQTIYEWKYNNPRAVAWEEHRNNEKDGISINATPNLSEVGLMSDSYYDFKPLMFFYDVNASITFNSNIYTFNSIEIYGEHSANFNGWTYNTAKGCYQVSGLGNTVSLTPTEGAEIYQFVDSIIFYANIALPQGVTPTETPGVYTVEWGSEISFVAVPASEEYYL
ncbi:MAG: hypothetical protein J6P74_06190, partial [Paludibacteraceae bacterium]|nr:hypothetical protein [Paludibacteraceae bacterium]